MKYIYAITLSGAIFSTIACASAQDPIHASPNTTPVHIHNKNETPQNSHPILSSLLKFLSGRHSAENSASTGQSSATTSHAASEVASTTTALSMPLNQSTQKTSDTGISYGPFSDSAGPFSFEPSAQTLKNSAGKIPVILVHGTWESANRMRAIYHSLDNAGIPAYAATFGTGGNSILGLFHGLGETKSAAESEKQLANYIAKVQAETGAKKVDLVGHSLGGLLIKDYLAHDTQNNVQAVVDLGATNHGTTVDGLSHLLYLFPKFLQNIFTGIASAVIGQSAIDQLSKSAYVENLNSYPDTKAGIHYLVLSSKDDTIETPYQDTYLHAVPGADVTNIEVHSIPGVTGTIPHGLIPLDPAIVDKVTNYIETNGEPKTSAAAQSVSQSDNHPTASKEISHITPPAVSLLD